MRLSDVLSKPRSSEYVQVENIFSGSSPKMGASKKANCGQICINYFCQNCDDIRTFVSEAPVYATLISKNIISVDCLLTCQRCSSSVAAWFLIESEQDIGLPAPKVRIMYRTEQMFNGALLEKPTGKFSASLECAERAYRDGYGAGAIIYLRKVFEQAIVDMAQLVDVDTKTTKGHRKKFDKLLAEVNPKVAVVSKQLPKDGYPLFSTLSEVIHAGYDEATALEKYPALKRLVISVGDNAAGYREIARAIDELGLDGERENV